MKYLISYWDNGDVKNRIVHQYHINTIQEAIQDHENEFGLEYYPIINVFELNESFETEIYDEDYE